MNQKEVVALSFDVDALKQSMRYAFANDITVVQELIQNVRRAGASTVWIDTGVTDTGEPTLSVLDNGTGLKNFQVLLHVAKSGWTDDLKANEGPYGMGFLSCIYASKHVEVTSLGKFLRMDQEQVLANGQFEVEEVDGALPYGAVTSVKMYGINTSKFPSQIPAIVKGYPIDILFNGYRIERLDSLDGSFCETPVGHIKRSSPTFHPSHAVIYLQGFMVHAGAPGYRGTLRDVVHLDPTKFYGKFPDRDVVINQADMLALVNAQLKGLYVETLLEAKKRLHPGVFVETYYAMAGSLGMLSVFNDVDVIPKSFMRQVFEMPHDTDWTDAFLATGWEGEFFTREQLQSGEIVIGQLEKFSTEDDTDNSLRWIFAYASKAWMLSKEIDEGHWLHGLVTLHEESDVTVKPVDVKRQGRTDSHRLQCIGLSNLVLCENVLVSMGDKTHLLGEPVAHEEANEIYVTLDADGKPMFVQDAVVQQLSSYRWDDEFHEDARDEDVHAINQMVRELASDSPEEQLALSLTAAISSFSTVRSLSCTIAIDAAGNVTVMKMATD